MNIISASTYHPFGETEVKEGSEHHLYTGKEKDSTGLYYYRARYYDPQIGKFITRDLIKGRKSHSQTLNLYTYCLNNPIKYIDPAGLDSMCTGDGENRVCIEFTANGWIATGYYNGDTTGVPITDSEEITALMNSDDPADQARAAYLMLLITHPEIQGDPSQIGKEIETGYLFSATIEDEEVELWIVISNEFFSEEGQYATTDITAHIKEDGTYSKVIKIRVFQSTFQSINHLYHVIGHEGVHVYELATTGITTEIYSYMWNFTHRCFPFAYPTDIEVLFNIVIPMFPTFPRLTLPK